MCRKYGTAAMFAFWLIVLICPGGCSRAAEKESRMGQQSMNDSLAGWPREVRKVEIVSRRDSAIQPALFWLPESGGQPAPLLVALHTWSGDYLQADGALWLEQARRRGWVFIHPDFRGPDDNPQATGSETATADILDAVEFAKVQVAVDTQRIYLAGLSGGGHMSLLTASRSPALWAGVSAWVPIADLARWHAECVERGNKYAADMEASCGGAPGASTAADSQYALRSSLPSLGALAGVPVEICAGIHDGHTGSVPVGHTLRAFNALAAANGKPEKMLTAEQIAWFEARESVPPELSTEREEDPAFGENKVLFRRSAGPARVTIFEGGHEGLPEAACEWLAVQSKGR